jgi:glycerol-3-phosphate dehydrogenase
MIGSKPSAIIIGAGFTGCALAYDLARRGFAVTVLERGELTSGTSGRTHGLLHSGARYCVTDAEAAIECIQENIILRNIASQCIEFNGGYFIALDEKDLAYATKFVIGAEACGIPTEEISVTHAIETEPALNPGILAAYRVPDGVFDPLRLGMAFAASAKAFGAVFHTYVEVSGFIHDGRGDITGVTATDRHTNRQVDYHADITVNATGAWAGRIAGLAGIQVPVKPTPGVMVAYEKRMTQHVINRLCEPDDGDILLPQRRMSVIGTTSFEIDDPDYIPVDPQQVNLMHERAALLIPELKHVKMRAAFMSARPLITGLSSGRSLSRTFKCYDHNEDDGVEGLVTVTGGKATTCRIMAEKTADLVCLKIGWRRECETRLDPLIDYHRYYQNEGVS